MKVYIVGVEITKYSWDNCVDRWDEVPRLLAICTSKASANIIAEQYNGIVTEVEVNSILNDNSYYECSLEGYCASDSNCSSCQYGQLCTGESGISII